MGSAMHLSALAVKLGTQFATIGLEISVGGIALYACFTSNANDLGRRLVFPADEASSFVVCFRDAGRAGMFSSVCKSDWSRNSNTWEERIDAT